MPPALIFGAGGVGAGKISYTWTTPETTSSLLTTLTSLNLLGGEKGFVVDTKIVVDARGLGGSLGRDRIRENVGRSLEFLGCDKVHILYAHAPDPDTPLEETAAAFDEQFRAGKFKKLGLCNYTTAQLSSYLEICTSKNYIKPSVYQGEYNAIARHAEAKLLPLLRAHNIVFYAYRPLAGGFLTGKVTFAPAPLTSGRYAPGIWPQAFDAVAAKPALHDAVRALHSVCDKHGISTAEASLRWLMHHSALREGDAVILGATRVGQLIGNVEACRKGPLDEQVRGAVEKAWEIAVGEAEDLF